MANLFGEYLALVKAKACKAGVTCLDLVEIKDCYDAGKSAQFCLDSWIRVESVTHTRTVPVLLRHEETRQERAMKKLTCAFYGLHGYGR